MTPDPRRWAVLAAGMAGLVAACAFQYGLPFLIPALRRAGLSLTEAGTLVSAPVAGLLLALVAWGAAADRWGERWVLAGGLGGAAIALTGAAATGLDHGTAPLAALLAVAGASSACVQVASGRLILGWFPAHERGLAMGLRQTGQPLGVGLAALTLPHLAGSAGAPDPARALLFLAACCAGSGALIAVGVRDVARPAVVPGERAPTPYRGAYLWRIHLASSLMVIPQFTVAAFAFDYLVNERHWSPGAAGPLLALAQVGGAATRLGAGWWSDRAGTRLRPMRTLCAVTAAVMAVLGLGALGVLGASGVAVGAVLLAAVVTVATNGLAFTAVAERAGQSWAGRALGVQNTAQNLVAAATPPVLAALITAVGADAAGYGTAFAVAVLFPALAVAVVPVAAEKRYGRAEVAPPEPVRR
jgi:MFS family permease